MRGIKNIKQALKILYLALKEKEIPWYAKVIFIALVSLYILSPIDAIPEAIPVVGILDDIAIIPLAAYLALLFIPRKILDELKVKTI
jgi:uncharacterized membrane protein YkvA (DUF1232 family)